MQAKTRERLGAAAVLIGLAVLHTWPLASSPARLSLNGNADAQLNEWIVSWIDHILPRHPGALFDGNIFAPEKSTLVYSEPLIVPALAAAPIAWLGGSPILMFNVLLIAGLGATGWCAWLVIRDWTGSWTAGLVSGALAAFNVHLLTRLPHLQAAHAWGLPLTLYFADRLADRVTLRRVGALALTIAATAATSLHWLVMTLLLVAIVAIVAIAGDRRWRAALALATGAAIGLLVALPVLWPYVRFAAGGAERPLEMVAQFSATPGGYLTSTSRLFKSLTHSLSNNPVNVFFPGVTATVLALVGFGTMRGAARVARRRAWVLASVAAIGFLLSLGPATSVYRAAYAVLLPLHGIRAAARFGFLVLLAVALSAGWGTAWLQRRMGASRLPAALLAPALLMLVSIEVWQGQAAVERFAGIPHIYYVVRDAPGPVKLAEFPFYLPNEVFKNGEYVLNATAHWRPLVNGYSGVTPDSYRELAEPMWLFPAGFAMDAIDRAGVTHVMVHLEKFGLEAPDVERALTGRANLRLMATDPLGHRLYEVVRR